MTTGPQPERVTNRDTGKGSLTGAVEAEATVRGAGWLLDAAPGSVNCFVPVIVLRRFVNGGPAPAYHRATALNALACLIVAVGGLPIAAAAASGRYGNLPYL